MITQVYESSKGLGKNAFKKDLGIFKNSGLNFILKHGITSNTAFRWGIISSNHGENAIISIFSKQTSSWFMSIFESLLLIRM